MRHYGKEYLFIDTAGIRRRSRIVDRVERYSVIKAFRSVDRADIVLLLMDSTEPVTEQDVRLAGYAHDKGRGIIILLNKWDLITKDTNTHLEFVDKVRTNLKYLAHAPILTLSALEGKRAVKVFGLIEDMNERYRRRIPTAGLNKFLEKVVSEHPPGMHRSSKRIKIYYLTQVRVAPPTFAFFCNYPESIHFSYQRFLENRIREEFDFGGAPLKLMLKRRREKDQKDRPRRRR